MKVYEIILISWVISLLFFLASCLFVNSDLNKIRREVDQIKSILIFKGIISDKDTN